MVEILRMDDHCVALQAISQICGAALEIPIASAWKQTENAPETERAANLLAAGVVVPRSKPAAGILPASRLASSQNLRRRHPLLFMRRLVGTKQEMRQSWLGWAMASILFLTAVQHVDAQFSPDLAQVRAAAEKGYAQAQSKLGDAYAGSFEYSQAERWYRSAAEKGIAHAQCRLGDILLSGRPIMKPGAQKVPANPEEAVQWFFRAANQGHFESQVTLGLCYKDGKGVKKDAVEAYKWFSLAAKKDSISGKVYRDQLVLKMSTQEIAEGDKRVASFKPNTSSSSPYASMLVLKGITGTKAKRMAIINNQTFAAGEEGNVKAGSKTLKIRCVEIREKSVVVHLIETGEQLELELK